VTPRRDGADPIAKGKARSSPRSESFRASEAGIRSPDRENGPSELARARREIDTMQAFEPPWRRRRVLHRMRGMGRGSRRIEDVRDVMARGERGLPHRKVSKGSASERGPNSTSEQGLARGTRFVTKTSDVGASKEASRDIVLRDLPDLMVRIPTAQAAGPCGLAYDEVGRSRAGETARCAPRPAGFEGTELTEE
jgi:hypothetical protein